MEVVRKPDRGKLRNAYFFLAVLTTIWVLEWSLYWISRSHQFAGATILCPMAPATLRFSDLTNILPRVLQLGHPGMLTRRDLGLPYPYPLPTVYACLLFAWKTRTTYVIFTAASFLAAALAFARYLWQQTHSIAAQIVLLLGCLLFHPFWFALDRGNIETVLWVLITMALVLYSRGSYNSAAVLLGIVASMKFYPGILFIIFLRKRQFRHILVGFSSAAALTVVTYMLAGPTLPEAIREANAGASFMANEQLVPLSSSILRWDHSVYAFIRQTDFVFMKKFAQTTEAQMNFEDWIRPYGICALSFLILVYWFRLRNLPLRSLCAALTLLAVTLPFVSYEYTLIHLTCLLGWFLLEDCKAEENKPPLLTGHLGTATAFLLAVTVSPLTNLAHGYYAGQVKCLCLLSLLVLIAIRSGIQEQLSAKI